MEQVSVLVARQKQKALRSHYQQQIQWEKRNWKLNKAVNSQSNLQWHAYTSKVIFFPQTVLPTGEQVSRCLNYRGDPHTNHHTHSLLYGNVYLGNCRSLWLQRDYNRKLVLQVGEIITEQYLCKVLAIKEEY